jgi:hypothetical protein
MLNLLEPRYFKHVKRLEEDLELSMYLKEEEAFPSGSLAEGSMTSADTGFDDLGLDDELDGPMGDLMGPEGHRGDVEDFIEDLGKLPGDYSELSKALERIIEIWHKGDEHLEHLEEEEDSLVEKFDGKVEGAKELMEEGGSITPNEVEKRFPEEDMETVLETFLDVHLELSSEGEEVAEEILKACEKANRNGLKEMRGRHDEMPQIMKSDLESLVKSIDELEKICKESIRRFEEAEEELTEAKNQFS